MLRLALGFLLLSTAIAASASGQTPDAAPPVEIQVRPDENLPNGLLTPETGQATVQIQIAVGCTTPPALAPMTVTVKVVSTPLYANVILNPPTQTVAISAEKCIDPTFREVVELDAIVTTFRSAPAAKEFTTLLETSILSEDRTFGPFAANFTLMNDYVPLTVINPAILFAKAAPNTKVVFPVEIQNLGNGPTRVVIDVTEPMTYGLDGINVGSDVRLESRADKGSTALYKQTRNVEIQTPASASYVNTLFTFQVRYTSQFDGAIEGVAADQLSTDKNTLAFAVQVQGGGAMDAPAPGFSSLLLVVGFVALIWIRRP